MDKNPDSLTTLAPEELSRLRPTVDVRALQRFLSVAPPTLRRLALVLCEPDPTPIEVRDAFETFDRPMEVAPGSPAAGAHPVRPAALPPAETLPPSKRLAFLPAEHIDYLFPLFDDPVLDELWLAVEPQRGGNA